MVSKPSQPEVQRGLNALRWPLRFTWLGMCFERAAYALWPLLSVVFLVLAVLMFGLHELLPLEIFWGSASLATIAGAAALGYAVYKFRVPSKTDAIARLDQSLPERPIQALTDTQAIGVTDAASAAVWTAHQTRMIVKAKAAKAVPAYVRLASRDPFALRYVAVIFFAVALIFGSVLRVGTVGAVALPDDKLSSGPVWEGWIDPPRYTGRPTLYLNDQPEGALSVPEGSLITLRLYGEVGALALSETVSGRTLFASASSTAHDFKVIQDGELSINGPNGRKWSVHVVPDIPPIVASLEGIDSDALGVMTLPFSAGDDYGVESGEAWITLDLDGVSRRHGLSVPPQARPELTVSLPMPVVGDRSGFEENLVEDFSKHPWANLPVVMNLTVLDAAEQQSRSEPSALLLPGRRFFDPMAAAIIEQRRDLLWSRANAQRISQILRAISHRPEDAFRNEVTQLRLRKLIERLETWIELDRLTLVAQDELAEELWTLAIELEEGDLADALERVRQAQERLNQAMRDGATNAEIAELMRELRDATEEYLKQLQKQQSQDGESPPQDGGNSSQMTQDDLQRMMDRIQELMEQGRMAEAEEALKELQEMMENMRVSEGEGQSGDPAGEQAMEGLSDTLREQQGLNDQAFRDLQEQFNPNAQAGESDGNVGRNGRQGEGESHEGQGGEGSGEGSSGPPSNQQDNLADRQQALRDELERQKNALPGASTPNGDAARDALERAGRAMENAEQALRQDQLGQAIDSQAQAMEALRDGLQSLAEALSENQEEQSPGQGEQDGNRQAQSRDPLGRGQNGDGVDPEAEGNVSDAEVYRRARDLLAEIRRRSAQGERTEAELDYLKRLIDRF
ncbi:TIGR02302 family protein [Ascidiaceihabitans sp.]|nr:TIGR02302 family protein [Ascidiaceihabitans sp.]